MPWVPLHTSGVPYTFNDLSVGGSQSLVNSTVTGTNVEADDAWSYTWQLEMPIGTQFRVTFSSFSMANPNPSPGTPSLDYCGATPSVEWTLDPDNVGFVTCTTPPFDEDFGTPWPTGVTVASWAPSPITGTVGETFEGGEPYLGLYCVGRYYDATNDLPVPFPASYSLTIDIWQEGGGSGCFWTDLDLVLEGGCSDDAAEDLREVQMLFKPALSSTMFRSTYVQWCAPVASLISGATSLKLTGVFPITDDPDAPGYPLDAPIGDICGDLYDVFGITQITNLAGSGPLTLNTGDANWEREYAAVTGNTTWFDSLCVVVLLVDDSITVYGLYEGRSY